MEVSTVQITKLVTTEGHILINKDGQTMGKLVYLSVNDPVENWSQITDAEADEIRTRLEAEAEAEAEAGEDVQE